MTGVEEQRRKCFINVLEHKSENLFFLNLKLEKKFYFNSMFLSLNFNRNVWKERNILSYVT